MGYDMHQIEEHPKAAESARLHQEEFDRLMAANRALAGEAERWVTPDEEATLGEEEARKVSQQRRIEWIRERIANRPDLTHGEIQAMAAKEAPVPASEAAIEADRALRAHIDKVVPFDSYFRLNIWGMERYRNEMEELGMANWEYDPGAWPERYMSGLDAQGRKAYEELDEALYELDASSPDFDNQVAEGIKTQFAGRGFDPAMVIMYTTDRKAVAAHLKKRGGVKGIAGHKFGSNDGWHVTAEECAEAVAIWDDTPEATQEAVVKKLGDYWLAWIDYLRRGAATKGFRVH